MNSDNEQIIQNQLDAYNNRNLENFSKVFHEDVISYDLKSHDVILSGREKLNELYTESFVNENLQSELIKRISLGNIVIDQEEVAGHPSGKIVRVLAFHEINDGLISKVWFSR